MSSVLHSLIGKDGFRLRGTAMSRIDGFSDVVFGFALTLLVVSLEVPKTYVELHNLMRGFVPFAVSFLLLMTIWYAHYLFFRRFGLHDVETIVLNALLLFVVLFYVYPLKFLFGMLVNEMMGSDVSGAFTAQHQIVELMVIYGLGFAAIYLLIAALYWNGWRQREALKLSELERMLTRVYIMDHLGMAAVGLISCLLAWLLPERQAGAAGLAYMLIGVTKSFFGYYAGHRVRKAQGELAAKPAPEC